jgi:hypothetical protein
VKINAVRAEAPESVVVVAAGPKGWAYEYDPLFNRYVAEVDLEQALLVLHVPYMGPFQDFRPPSVRQVARDDDDDDDNDDDDTRPHHVVFVFVVVVVVVVVMTVG